MPFAVSGQSGRVSVARELVFSQRSQRQREEKGKRRELGAPRDKEGLDWRWTLVRCRELLCAVWWEQESWQPESASVFCDYSSHGNRKVCGWKLFFTYHFILRPKEKAGGEFTQNSHPRRSLGTWDVHCEKVKGTSFFFQKDISKRINKLKHSTRPTNDPNTSYFKCTNT